MALQLDLTKSAEKLRLDLTKATGREPPEAEVCFDLDVSGSYIDMHMSGVTTKLMSRLIPWGMVFDPDQKLDVYTFSGGPAHYVGEITAANREDYVQRNIVRKVPNWDGGTIYVPVIRSNLERFGWIAQQGGVAKSGLFGRIFGRAGNVVEPVKRRSLVLFNTDGENRDKGATERLLQEMQDNEYRVYIQFIAVCQSGSDFSFLERMADKFRNCGLVIIEDIYTWVDLSDDAINQQFITDELVEWMRQAV